MTIIVSASLTSQHSKQSERAATSDWRDWKPCPRLQAILPHCLQYIQRSACPGLDCYSLLALLRRTPYTTTALTRSLPGLNHCPFSAFHCLLDRVSPSAPPFRRVKSGNRVRGVSSPGHSGTACRPPIPVALNPDRCHSHTTPVYPYSARPLETAANRCSPRCYTLQHNTHIPHHHLAVLPLLTKRRLINRTIHRSASHFHRLLATSFGLRVWLDFPPGSARPGNTSSLHKPSSWPCKERLVAPRCCTHYYTHCAAFTYANTLTHAVCISLLDTPPTKRGCVVATPRPSQTPTRLRNRSAPTSQTLGQTQYSAHRCTSLLWAFNAPLGRLPQDHSTGRP